MANVNKLPTTVRVPQVVKYCSVQYTLINKQIKVIGASEGHVSTTSCIIPYGIHVQQQHLINKTSIILIKDQLKDTMHPLISTKRLWYSTHVLVHTSTMHGQPAYTVTTLVVVLMSQNNKPPVHFTEDTVKSQRKIIPKSFRPMNAYERIYRALVRVQRAVIACCSWLIPNTRTSSLVHLNWFVRGQKWTCGGSVLK